MVTSVVKAPVQKSSGKKSTNIGLKEAGLVLEFIEGMLHCINLRRSFEITMPSEKQIKNWPHVMQRIEDFRKYADSIPLERFESPWVKYVGGMGASHCNTNGNIHLFMIDDGLLSKSIPPVGTNDDMTYKMRSRFFCNQVFGLDVHGQRLKGNIHLHALDIKDVVSAAIQEGSNNAMFAIRNLIAKEHGPNGNYILRSKVKPFSLKKRCPDGYPVRSHQHLVMNSPDWLQQQMLVWRS